MQPEDVSLDDEAPAEVVESANIAEQPAIA